MPTRTGKGCTTVVFSIDLEDCGQIVEHTTDEAEQWSSRVTAFKRIFEQISLKVSTAVADRECSLQ